MKLEIDIEKDEVVQVVFFTRGECRTYTANKDKVQGVNGINNSPVYQKFTPDKDGIVKLT